MKRILTIFIIKVISINISAQSVETDTLAQAKIAKLEFLVGQWEGRGWMLGQDRQKYEFNQTEDIQFKLDGTALLIEGKGMSNGNIIHDAMAIVTYDKQNDQYHFQSYLANGRNGNFKAELIDEKFYWYPRENMRYIIAINDDGQWLEKGEYNNQGNWFQFFEMTLGKK